MEFAIRPAVPADVAALQKLIEASVRGLQTADYDAEQIARALQTVFDVDTQLIDDGTYFVASLPTEPTILGCGGWSRRATLFGGAHWLGRADTLLDPRSDAAKIRAFFVAPASTRCGIATRLLTTCETAAAAAGFMRLELASTLTGVALYEARGYTRTESAAVRLDAGLTLPIVRMAKQIG